MPRRETATDHWPPPQLSAVDFRKDFRCWSADQISIDALYGPLQYSMSSSIKYEFWDTTLDGSLKSPDNVNHAHPTGLLN